MQKSQPLYTTAVFVIYATMSITGGQSQTVISGDGPITETPNGPKADVIERLIDVHTRNGTLGKLLNSAIGDRIREALNTQIAILKGRTIEYGDEVWSYDGETLAMIADVDPGPDSSQPDLFTAYDGAIYFRAFLDSDLEAWRLDADGTLTEYNINPVTSSNPDEFTEFDGFLYFAATDENDQRELWRINSEDILETIEVNTSPGDSSPSLFTIFNEALFFRGVDGYEFGSEVEIWKLDKDDNVTKFDINPTVNCEFICMPGSSEAFYFSVFNNRLYFRAFDGIETELWYITSDDIPYKMDISTIGSSNPKYMTPLGDSLYFSASDGFSEMTWRLNGDGVLTSYSVELTNSVENFTKALNSLYFSGTNDGDRELWKIDADGVLTEFDINPNGSSNPRNMTGYKGSLYFLAFTGNGAERELFKLKPDGTLIELDFSEPGAGGAVPLGVVNNVLVVSGPYDEDGDGVRDRTAMWAAFGDPESVEDFVIVDDSTTDFPRSLLVLFEDDQFPQ